MFNYIYADKIIEFMFEIAWMLTWYEKKVQVVALWIEIG